MITKIAWNTFKNTGDINSYLEYRKTKNIENLIKENINVNEESKSQWSDFNRK